jgi:hypothetical protein
MTEERRSVLHDPERYPVVTKTGLIKMCPVASNLGGALTEYEGEVKVAFSHQKEQWVLLRDLYEKENRLDHFAVFENYRAAKKAGHEVPPFPDKYLPAEVLRRRAGEVPGRKVWTPPDERTEEPRREGKRRNEA